MTEEQQQLLSKSLASYKTYFTTRTFNALNRNNIRYVGDLVKCNEWHLLKLRNFGRDSLEDVKTLVNALGLSLNMKVIKLPPEGVSTINKWLDKDIKELNLPVAIFNALKAVHIDYIADLIVKSEAEVTKIWFVGKKRAQTIKHALKQIGLQLDTAASCSLPVQIEKPIEQKSMLPVPINQREHQGAKALVELDKHIENIAKECIDNYELSDRAAIQEDMKNLNTRVTSLMSEVLGLRSIMEKK